MIIELFIYSCPVMDWRHEQGVSMPLVQRELALEGQITIIQKNDST